MFRRSWQRLQRSTLRRGRTSWPRLALILILIIVSIIIIGVIISRMPHICGMDTYGMKIMPQMSGIATFQDIYGMLIFEDEHAIDV